jgi:hypothetical protein
MASIPVPYIGTGGQAQTVLGHYSTAQKSGNFTGWAANDVVGSIRWAPTNTNYFLVLMRLKWGIVTQATATAGVYDVGASIARAFTVDFTTAATAVNMATTQKTNLMRGSMSLSQMGTSGPRIATTTTQSGQTYTLDATPFAADVANLTGTTVGISSGMRSMYEWTGLGQHPLVLSNQEGVSVRMLTASAGGTYNVYLQWEWAEVLLF